MYANVFVTSLKYAGSSKLFDKLQIPAHTAFIPFVEILQNFQALLPFK